MGSSQISSHAFDQHRLSTAKDSGAGAEFNKLEVIRAHEPLIRSAIRAARTRGLLLTEDQVQDARQAAILGLLEALERYDEGRGFTFGAYARQYVYGAVHKTLSGDARYWSGAEGVPPDDHDLENEPVRRMPPSLIAKPDNSMENREAGFLLEQFVKSLPPQQEHVVIQVFHHGRKQTAVAMELGVSRMAVNGLIKRAAERGRRLLDREFCTQTP